MNILDTNYINGRWVAAHGGTFDAVDPFTRERFARITLSTQADVDDAVSAAAAAFAAWSTSAISERARVLKNLHEILIARTEEFVQAMAQEIGSPVWFGRALQMPMPIRNLELAIESMAQLLQPEPIGTSLVVREPIGVVAAITPWNAPLHQIVAKVGAALAAGCTIVLKPSEIAPLTARLFATAVNDARVPPGVFNMVFGDGAAGSHLVGHPDVDMVSFTGSSNVGRAVAATAAQGTKKVTLELGGKSASILLDGGNIAQACETILRQCFSNSGQICVAQSRFLVPRADLPKVEALCAENTRGWTLGDPRESDTRIGPVATASQYERVRKYIEIGQREGAKLLVGGAEPVESLKGYFIRPTIFSEVTRDMTIAKEEIFGPVLCIMPYDGIEDAIAIANSLRLGLSGGVWSQDREAAIAIARRMRTGQVALNGAPQNLATPFGGYGESGYGRENGRFGVEEFLNYKAIHGAV